ncbi:hypothetical protein RRG08_035110 [Elysia crispata]|uniref:Uncharacterized protein n=1 Tax=Elysia crispata TaxID=231223 RepID=A0AAE0ZSA6_9GAST|nr:hypothetical protein RRG08_035110 [Elysia crispata]
MCVYALTKPPLSSRNKKPKVIQNPVEPEYDYGRTDGRGWRMGKAARACVWLLRRCRRTAAVRFETILIQRFPGRAATRRVEVPTGQPLGPPTQAESPSQLNQ